VKLEGTLSRELLARATSLLPGAVIFKHSDRFTSSMPDASVSWGRTAWLEVKVSPCGESVRPHKNWGLQLLTAMRLERATGLCWFVVYMERRGSKLIHIVRPRDMGASGAWSQSATIIVGHDHDSVVEFIRGALKP